MLLLMVPQRLTPASHHIWVPSCCPVRPNWVLRSRASRFQLYALARCLRSPVLLSLVTW